MLKRVLVLVSLFVLMLVAPACGKDSGGSSDTSNSSSSGSAQVTLNEDYTDALPVSSQLAIGTLMLEGTDNAVTVDQAGKLLPSWQMLQALQSSGTAAQAELDAVLKQIQGSMTNEQLTTIKEMKITLDSMQQLAQEQGQGDAAGGAGGFAFPFGAFFGGEGGPQPPAGVTGGEGGSQPSAGTTGGGSSDRGGGGGFQPPAGGFAGGGDFMGGGAEGGFGPGAFGGDDSQNPEQRATAQAEGTSTRAGTMMTRMVVSLLEARAKGETWGIAAPDRGFDLQRTLIAAVAEATSLDQREIMTQTREGKTLLEIVEANGADADQIVAQVVAAETERVNQAVADGSMAQADADQSLADLEARVKTILEQTLQPRDPGALPDATAQP